MTKRYAQAKAGFEVMEMRAQVAAICRMCRARAPGCRAEHGCKLKVQMALVPEE